jgi:hypothetical protein
MPAYHYKTDFFAWTQEQSALIRAKRWSEIDVEHLADEIEDMGKSERRALESRLEILLMHLLKWQVQKDRRSNSWRRTIKDQRRRLEKLLSENPSLKAELLEFVEDVYPSAIVAAANETGLDDENFPANCPYSVEQILDSNYLPE